MIPHTHLTYILAATLGAGAMFSMQPPLPQSCEPVELLRFVGKEPEIHVIEPTTFGRSQDEWLAQFAEAEPEHSVVASDEDEPVRRHHRRRRHGRR